MPCSKINASITVEKTDQKRIALRVQALFDSFAVERIAVFDSEISCVSVPDPENADEVRREMKQP